MKCNSGHYHNGKETAVLDQDNVDHQWDTCGPIMNKMFIRSAKTRNQLRRNPHDGSCGIAIYWTSLGDPDYARNYNLIRYKMMREEGYLPNVAREKLLFLMISSPIICIRKATEL